MAEIEKSKYDIQPRVQGPQTIPAQELSEIKTVIEQVINGLAFKRSCTIELGGYVAKARIIGTQWRGEVVIGVERKGT